jgi:hypothetical protein
VVEAGARAELPSRARLGTAEVQARLGRLDSALRAAEESVAVLALDAESPALKNAVALGRHLLGRLRVGWNASGLWSSQALNTRDAPEVEAIEEELVFRLRAIERAAMLRAGELAPRDAGRLATLCESLRAVTV